jgi:hypothetical protein
VPMSMNCRIPASPARNRTARCMNARFSIVILSFRVSRGCDLGRPVVDGVVDGTLAA